MRRSLLLKDTDASKTAHEAKLSCSDKVLFHTVLFCAKNVLPNDLVNRLLELQTMHGTECKYIDLHSDTVLDVQQSLVAVVDGLVNDELCNANVFSLLCDESTDLSVNKNLIMYARFVNRSVLPRRSF